MPDVPEMQKTINLVVSESTTLGQFLSGLAPEDWERDSACAEWQVGDVIAHLTQGAIGWAAALNRAVQGDYGPPPGQRPLQPGERGSETTAQAAIETRQATATGDMLSSFVAGYEKLEQQMRELRAEDWEKPCYHRRGVIPVHAYVTRRIQELSIHGWDVRSAFDLDYELSQDATPLLMGVTHRWLHTTFAPLEGVPTPVRFRFEISDPASLREDVVIGSNGFEIESAGGSSPDVTFRCNGSSYILLVFGRLRADGGAAPGRISVAGDRNLAAKFSQWFQGV
ncbi:MAG: maleylpyruvate isomerase family mycothiol-dependent enzyme, partial [Dehalococcoidia bacterium]